MDDRERIVMKKWTLYILCVALALAFAASLTAYGAETGEKVVRVGWYESAFHLSLIHI